MKQVRTLSFTRRVQMNGKWSPHYIYIDGKKCAVLESGETVNIRVDCNQHSISICADFDKKYWSREYVLSAGTSDYKFYVFIKTRLLTVDVYLEQH